MNITRIRYVVVTADEKKIFCGLARHYEFKDIDNIGNTAIKTYLSENKAKSSFLDSWWDSKESDFEPNGKYKVVKVIEQIQKID